MNCKADYRTDRRALLPVCLKNSKIPLSPPAQVR
jgi:hypothetical protein